MGDNSAEIRSVKIPQTNNSWWCFVRPVGKPADSWADLGESALPGGPRHLAWRQEDSAAGWGTHFDTCTHTHTVTQRTLKEQYKNFKFLAGYWDYYLVAQTLFAYFSATAYRESCPVTFNNKDKDNKDSTVCRMWQNESSLMGPDRQPASP